MSQGNVRPGAVGARSPQLDGIVRGVAVFAMVVGWPSAVVLFCAHEWGSLYSSDAAKDVERAIILLIGCFAAFAFAVMGFGPWIADERRFSGRELLVLLAVAFGPTIVLALFFYGQG
jgi:hypothetical protein